jgi:hypothetical protein
MKSVGTRVAILALVGLAGDAAEAQQALVRTFQNTALEIGQAYLTHYGSRCIAVLPTHVAVEAGEVAAFLREGGDGILGESSNFAHLGDDVSVADISGGIRSDCGYSTLAVSRAVASRIKANALASVRSVNGDGSIAQIPVAIIDDDGARFLRIQPTTDRNQIRKGQSGSLLMAGDTPVGMLLSVDGRFGVGKVIRLDAMLHKIDGYIAHATAMPASADDLQPSTTSTTAMPGVAGTITSWSAMPLDAEHRAANLVAPDDSREWIASVDRWPVVIEMELSEGRAPIAGVELDAKEITDRGSLPATIELMVSNTESGRRWRSVWGGAITFVDDVARIAVAPSWARHVRLVVSESAAGGNTLALRRFRVLPAD